MDGGKNKNWFSSPLGKADIQSKCVVRISESIVTNTLEANIYDAYKSICLMVSELSESVDCTLDYLD
jgi:hypothetical protein